MTPSLRPSRLPARARAAVSWLAVPVSVAAVMTSAAGSYLVRTLTALAAAGLLLHAARRHGDGLGRSRVLFAGALLTGAVSGLLSALYLLVAGHPAAAGWVGDWVYLGYAPCAVLGALALPRASDAGSWVRALADGAVAAGSLWYLSMALLVDPRHLGGNLAGAERLMTLAYPLAPAFVVAVMLSALPRVTAPARPMLAWAAAGMTLLGVADAAFSYVNWSGTYQPTSWVAGLNQLGLLALLAAASVVARPASAVGSTARATGEAPRGLLVVAAPYAPLVLALVAALGEVAAGEGLPPGELPPIVLIGAAVVARHVASTRETGRLMTRLVVREQAARSQAMSDPLTSLANRTAFVAALDAALQDPRNHPVAVALLDLNDFKDINDTHGHDTGDEVLRRTADRLRDAVPAGAGRGEVARLGGDEFAAFVAASRDHGRSLGDAIAAAFADPVVLGVRTFQVRPSVGVVVDERPAGAARPGDASHLLAHADVAMYEAKKEKATEAVPVAVLTGRARAAAAATIRLRDEASTPPLGQFRLEYQPVVDLRSGQIHGAEALLRWRHPEFGEISPATFIPLAERLGSVGVLGDFVLDAALHDLALWTQQGHRLVVGINVSPRQLADDGFASSVLARLARRRLAPEHLTVEVTEEALVSDLEPVVRTIHTLRAAGVGVAVDDFGTGYSSLRYLRRFEASAVKVDREFVQASPTEPRTEALVRSVVSMASALDMVCVAEGIETLEQLALVRAHGCRLGQGFLLARPMPAESLGALLAEGHVYPVEVGPPTPVEWRVGAPISDMKWAPTRHSTVGG